MADLEEMRAAEIALGGGAGNPGGKTNSGTNGQTGTGGLLIIYADKIDNSNGTIESVGTSGGSGYKACGGSSGGGSVNIFYKTEFIGDENINVNGGSATSNGYSRRSRWKWNIYNR